MKKQETLEEAAENKASIFYKKGTIEWNKYRQIFKDGAQWQSEKNVKVAEEFTIKFARWLRYNCIEEDYGWQNYGKYYSDREIVKLFKKEIEKL